MTREQEVKSEIARLKALPLPQFKNRNRKFNDPLMWWKEHQHQFPLLAQLARRFLSTQSALAASERILSKAERVTADRRAGLDADIAVMLIVMKDALRWFESDTYEEDGDEQD